MIPGKVVNTLDQNVVLHPTIASIDRTMYKFSKCYMKNRAATTSKMEASVWQSHVGNTISYL